MNDIELVDQLTAFFDRPAEIALMVGSTSSDLYEVRTAAERCVLRIFRQERWQTPSSVLSLREHAILGALEPTPIRAPRSIGILPDNGVLMGWMPGQVVLPARPDETWFGELARVLAEIHSSGIEVPYQYGSWNEVRGLPAPDWWQNAGLWQAAQAAAAEAAQFEPTFIHRDYHPTNVLWEHDRIVGVVDWINACMGPAGIDVAHCRLNLALMYGMTAADAFLDAYRHQAPGYQHDPYWDLDDAMGALPEVRPYPPWEVFGLTGLTTGSVRRRIQLFIESAVSSLPAR